jgi:RND family efflux transporter MFP subunit
VRAIFGVPDSAIARIKLGQKQTVQTEIAPNGFVGHVSAISPAADPRSRIYSVEVTIPNPKDELKSGMIASLSLNGEMLWATVLGVPLEAVIRNPANADQFAVLVTSGVGDSVTADARPVELGNSYGNMVQILGGVKAGDRVITAGSNLVKSGDLVRVMQ